MTQSSSSPESSRSQFGKHAHNNAPRMMRQQPSNGHQQPLSIKHLLCNTFFITHALPYALSLACWPHPRSIAPASGSKSWNACRARTLKPNLLHHMCSAAGLIVPTTIRSKPRSSANCKNAARMLICSFWPSYSYFVPPATTRSVRPSNAAHAPS